MTSATIAVMSARGARRSKKVRIGHTVLNEICWTVSAAATGLMLLYCCGKGVWWP